MVDSVLVSFDCGEDRAVLLKPWLTQRTMQYEWSKPESSLHGHKKSVLLGYVATIECRCFSQVIRMNLQLKDGAESWAACSLSSRYE